MFFDVTEPPIQQLDDSRMLSDFEVSDGATLSVQLRLRGGAALRAKVTNDAKLGCATFSFLGTDLSLYFQKEAEALKKRQEMEEEYNNWHKISDRTESTGVMRVVQTHILPGNVRGKCRDGA